ncbi:hypothetical protein SISSUDRAFT_995483, partial [Sistotremastrum suecicum HHB10207 ss-3]
RSVHNVRIERLWVDVTAQVGAKWSAFFTQLELHCGLDINNADHLWLLHSLFLPVINAELQFFAEAWNEHKIDSKTGPRRSPWDMWVFDMLVLGVRGNPLESDQPLTSEELEVYGIDWPAFNQQDIRSSQASNNPRDEGDTSWIRRGFPAQLNGVELDAPQSDAEHVDIFQEVSYRTQADDQTQRWHQGFALVYAMYPDLF